MPTLAEHANFYAKQWWHRRIARAVLDTPPIVPADDGVILFAMAGTAVLYPYLVSVKSLHQGLGGIGRVVILDDGTFTASDRAVLRHHLGDPRIIPISAVDVGPCPVGGTWERLLTLLDLRRDAYVIQADSDTVTLGDLPEVRAAVAAGRSFTLRGEAEAELADAVAFAATRAPVDLSAPSLHVQEAAESVLGRIAVPGIARLRYARGCAGFAGFARSGEGRAPAEAFSVAVEREIGRARWERWGSEQVTSNFVVANQSDPLLLPYHRYFNFWDEGVPTDARFAHFIGTCRFNGMAYIDATRAAIARLRDQPVRRTSAISSTTVERANTASQPA
ncbi:MULTISPECIES: hypothetical protein [unclassified Sphingomonas]|jgi:hypothetical protein|uniref:hypothetical protein n=1 Tax=unclassified Sphingomonas TaxID=196159 RepID=UPI000836AF19|nr:MULTISPECIES: hypothetical protein [unclassified Sphingomonas]